MDKNNSISEEKKNIFKKISGTSLTGETRIYLFKLPYSQQALRVFHEYAAIVLAALPVIRQTLQLTADEKAENADLTPEDFESRIKDLASGKRLLPLLGLIPQILSIDRIENLQRVFLSGVEIETEDGKYIANNEGHCDLFGSDPLELFTAVFYALAVNYPKYFSSFFSERNPDTTLDS
jgi:PAS domain-containing protein